MQGKAVCGTILILIIFFWASPGSPLTLTSDQEKKIQKSTFLTEVEVTSPSSNKQKLVFQLIGLHPKRCERVLRVLSRYENYSKYLDYVKSSSYVENAQRISLILDSPLLPFPLELNFQLPRIERPGAYPFVFPTGIFPNLRGEIKVDKWKNSCLFFITANWEGPTTRIPGLIIEIFSQTLMERGMEKLFKVSEFH